MINASRWFEDVPKATWEFHVGGYQPCEKWLKDRAAKGGKKQSDGRVLTDEDTLHYRRMVTALTETRRIMAEIDKVIESTAAGRGRSRWAGRNRPMAMRSAIHYPDTHLQSPQAMASAMLLWDKLRVIVPFDGYRIEYDNCDMAGAWELIGKPLIPDDENKRQAHKSIETMLAAGVPRQIQYREICNSIKLTIFGYRSLVMRRGSCSSKAA